ncbi:MAG: hypothetical protein Q4D94_10705 [Bacillota bacterium]|nr:hypothetical protein [Bacillota bacterium]
MSIISFLSETFKVLGAETLGVAVVVAVLFGYVKLMHSHNA